jgi:hypothetical protein
MAWKVALALVCVVALVAAQGPEDADFVSGLPTYETQMLLDEAAHKKMVKASYQSNVKTIYFHLEEIIKKILAHKEKWTAKYNGDLANIAKGILKHKNIAKELEKKYIKAKGKAQGLKKLAGMKNKSWQKAKNRLKEKMNDAKKERKALKDLYLKGLTQKEGEICMIRRIQCMVAKFNGEEALQTKYCNACKDGKLTKSGKKDGASTSVGGAKIRLVKGPGSIGAGAKITIDGTCRKILPTGCCKGTQVGFDTRPQPVFNNGVKITKTDSKYRLIPGLAGGNTVSIQDCKTGKFVARDATKTRRNKTGFDLVMLKKPAAKSDASFELIKTKNGYSFVRQGRTIRHQNHWMKLSPMNAIQPAYDDDFVFSPAF